jgi:diguanylate cyclase (GGDEF)-like protein
MEWELERMRGLSRLQGTVLRACFALSAAGMAAYVAWILIPFGGETAEGFFNKWTYDGLIVLAFAVCALRAVWVAQERAAWLMLAAGLGCWATGEILYSFAYDSAPPFPSAADACYLAFYLCAYVGLLLLVRVRVSRINGSVWLDGLMGALAAGALGAAILFQAVLETTEGSAAEVITNLAYPLGDVLLLALVVGVAAITGWSPDRGWIAIGAALAATAIADGIYLFQSANGSYAEGTLLDTLWPASVLLLAWAGWMRAGTSLAVELEGRPLVATPAVCGAVGLGLLASDHFHRLNALALALAIAAVIAVFVRTGLTFVENGRILARIRTQAVTDPLTGLGNRRKLLAELSRVMDGAPDQHMLIIFDLDGFKSYNDTFGHPAGDALLTRLGNRLASVAAPHGSTYRLGGDEFSVLARVPAEGAESLLERTVRALSDEGEGFTVTSSFGAVFLGNEAADPREALGIADQRLYAQKRTVGIGRGKPHAVLLQAISEREPELRTHVRSVAELSLATGRRLGLEAPELERLRFAAELHDVGKLAIPDDVLSKPGVLDEHEWAFIREHTIVGHRILSASPALHEVATIVRSTHERWDGTGYPDGLAGEEIPLAARIIFVCDALVAMTTDRPYSPTRSRAEAVVELRRCAGTQFDPRIAQIVCDIVASSGEALDVSKYAPLAEARAS